MFSALRSRLSAIRRGPALPAPRVSLFRTAGEGEGGHDDDDDGMEAGSVGPERWMVVTDAAIHGKSKAEAESDGEGGVVLSGVLDTEPGPGVDKSGFVSFRTCPGVVVPSLEYYDAFELVVKGDGRGYQFNVGCESVVPDDLHQAALPPQDPNHKDQWATVRIPFDALIMTWRGFVQVEQLEMDPRRITSLGFTLADDIDGPFSLHIRDIRAVRVDDLDANDPNDPNDPNDGKHNK